MMKQVLFIISLFLSSLYIYAQEYTIEEIKHDALLVLNGSTLVYTADRVSTSQKEIQSVTPINRGSKPYLYIVNAADSAGWVIVSNEQRYSTHIIGSNDYGTFSADDMSPALAVLLEQHKNAIDSVRSKGVKEQKSAGLVTYATPNSPILLGENHWNQRGNNGNGSDCDRIYNKYAVRSIYKKDACGKHAAGCGAVAMGQIMRYWHWPDYAFIPDTIVRGEWLGGKKIRWYDWDNMPDEITDNSPMVQVDAIAGLLRDCGYAAHTTYHKDGSLALFKDIHSAMEDIFHYHATREHEYAWTEIAPKLRSELNAYRPVLCQAWNAVDTAHSFVIDGYRTTNNKLEFHINFGWGGKDNGYYDLNFNGYDGNRTFLTEIYPDCSARNENVYLATNETVKKDKIFNFYTANDIYVCHNNNSIVVESGGKMLLRAGNSVTLKPGFQAKAGSNVEISILSSCTEDKKRFAPRRTNNDGTLDETDYQDNQTATETPLSVVKNIDRCLVYNASGQLLQTVNGEEVANTLPCGFYIVQTMWDDGSVSVEKVAKQ